MPGYLEIADGEVGYRAPASNVTKYWADLEPSFQGLAWCGAFVSWCLWKAGSLSAIGGEMFYVPAMVDRARARGQWASNPVVGALVIFNFNTGSAQHVGFCTGVGSGSISTIEGNTSSDGVDRKTRSSGIMGYWHITAAAGSIPPSGTGDSGASWYQSAPTRVPRPAETIAGEEGEVLSVFGSRGRFVNA